MANFESIFSKCNKGWMPHLCVEMSGNHQYDLSKTLDFVEAVKTLELTH